MNLKNIMLIIQKIQMPTYVLMYPLFKTISIKFKLSVLKNFIGHKKNRILLHPFNISSFQRMNPLTIKKMLCGKKNILLELEKEKELVGIFAVTAATVGGALPIVLGVGTAIGASLGMGKIATIAGLILMSVGCVGIITGIAGLIGAIKRKFSNKKNLDPASRLNHDIPQIKKNTPQNTHQSIRTCLSNLKNTITLYTNKNHVQLQEENIETVLRFLKDKLDFFAAPFRDRKS